ncbi:glycosyltransferase family 4 protein [Pedobacter jejuensis]|uniref:Glycosyltransferase family 4 protein n=1 Tax=Pedobacter jejuensis TaxID=1268550 RepID=A0A3N0C0E9_9SPHI|nr:glycosyltransferase family 4 protein [Pedobacter jejuensis]RNL55749.1 glycosyltransferase family 4 protein [Pedobacter jejuensis]
MKIGIIAHLKHPISAPFAGGLEVFTHQITKLLVERGHEVILFASSNSDSSLPVESILSDNDYDKQTGVRIKRKDLPSEYIAEHHAYFNLMMHIDNYDLDVIFNNSLHYIPITMANTVQTPMLTVLHTPPFYELDLAIRSERKNPVINYVTVSKQSAANWQKQIENCAIIPNGIVIEDWVSYPDKNIDEYAVWFGRIHPDKGLHLAIEASKKAEIKLKVAGAIADQRYYDSKIAPVLDETIECLGLLNHQELNALIGGAQVCLITPCWQEPFGLVVAEAMACGTPIVGFKMGALPELIDEHCGILVDFANTDALAAAIQSASNFDRTLVAQSAMRFDIHKMIDKYEQMLENIISQHPVKQAYQ